MNTPPGFMQHHLGALRSAPPAALVLGFGGLLPFAAAALAFAMTAEARWLSLLVAYKTVITSFIGALHWGYAVAVNATGTRAWRMYGWSVVPALLAWLSLLLPAAMAARLLAVTLLACLAVDCALARVVPGPPWLLPLRFVLSCGAATSLAIGGWA